MPPSWSHPTTLLQNFFQPASHLYSRSLSGTTRAMAVSGTLHCHHPRATVSTTRPWVEPMGWVLQANGPLRYFKVMYIHVQNIMGKLRFHRLLFFKLGELVYGECCVWLVPKSTPGFHAADAMKSTVGAQTLSTSRKNIWRLQQQQHWFTLSDCKRHTHILLIWSLCFLSQGN